MRIRMGREAMFIPGQAEEIQKFAGNGFCVRHHVLIADFNDAQAREGAPMLHEPDIFKMEVGDVVEVERVIQ